MSAPFSVFHFLIFFLVFFFQFIIYGDVFDTPQSDVLFVNFHLMANSLSFRRSSIRESLSDFILLYIKYGDDVRYIVTSEKVHYLIMKMKIRMNQIDRYRVHHAHRTPNT